jgi:hypothetical protein
MILDGYCVLSATAMRSGYAQLFKLHGMWDDASSRLLSMHYMIE